QTATHFPPEQLAALTRLYKNVERAELYSTHEMEDWGDLFAMVGPGRRLDPASEADLRKSLGRARDDSRTLATVSAFMVVLAANLDLPFRPSERDELDYVK